MCTCGIAPVQSYLLRPDTGCAGLIYLMDWIEGLEEKAGSPPQVSLSVHLQRTQKGFGLQIGYSAELRQLVVEGVYDFVQSSEGWPVCKGDILKAVDKHDLAPNNNGQWLIDNVVKTFQNIQEKTRVSFLRPVTNEHARVLRAIRRSLARLFHLERDVTRWYPQLGVLYIRSLLERLNTAFIAMYTRPCGTVAAKASNDPSRDDARAVEAARLRGWVRVSALLDVEVGHKVVIQLVIQLIIGVALLDPSSRIATPHGSARPHRPRAEYTFLTSHCLYDMNRCNSFASKLAKYCVQCKRKPVHIRSESLL